ncbi:MAG: hypothetical protein COX51_03540 [Syntrophobacteraceae bacterium CG23_combo_of_CG06-09_8_20_14_all_50_8]|nr:MAG: hypothetical protein COX51_03540 [Syntrophobacteraceae bacterium CG23_combo_of_CG06-09_8_20_14_all_50_8]
MRKVIIFMVLVMATLGSTIPRAEAGTEFGISVGEEGLRSFYLSVGDHYRVPQREVVIIRERGIPYEEMPVVFFIAGRAHVAPGVIVDLRLRGMSWMDITFHYGLSPEIYYVPLRVAPGPPYGRAYGYYKKWPRKKWRKVRLGDDDVVNLVNLKFASEHYGYSPEKVIKMRSGGRNFVEINEEIKRGREPKVKEKRGVWEKESKIKEKEEKQRGKGKGKFED